MYCMAEAFASILKTDVQNIYEYLGHDGSEIIWPELEEPLCRRTFHPQELIRFCLSHGHAVTQLEPEAELIPQCGYHGYNIKLKPISQFIINNDYVACVIRDDGCRHAIPVHRGQIICNDPFLNGHDYEIKIIFLFYMKSD